MPRESRSRGRQHLKERRVAIKDVSLPTTACSGEQPGRGYLLVVQVLRHEVLQRIRHEAVDAVDRLRLQGLDDLTRCRRLGLEQDRKLLRRVLGVGLQARRAERGGFDDRRRFGRVGVVTDIESATGGEQRLTRGVVVRRVAPAATPRAELVLGAGFAVRDDVVEARFGVGELEANRVPVGDLRVERVVRARAYRWPR